MFEAFIFLVYAAVAYWAVGQTFYANKIRIGTWSKLVATQFAVGVFTGWFIIPIAIIKKFLQK